MSRCIALLFLQPRRLDGGGLSAPRPGRFTPGKDPVPIVQEAGWAPRAGLDGCENLAPTGIRSPDRTARSESLFRLSYQTEIQKIQDRTVASRVRGYK